MVERRTNAPFLGKGWAFPPRFDSNNDTVMVSGSTDVAESLRILMSTRLGERVMLPLYGTPLDTFEGMTVTVQNNVKSQVRAAIVRYEPRVKVHSGDVDVPDGGREGLMLIKVEYEIPSTNSRANMVYRFYLNEGNRVRLQPGAPPDGGGV